MPSPRPINAVQTRVVKDAHAKFWPQFSHDGLSWSPIGTNYFNYQSAAVATAFFFEEQSILLPAQGEVVWRSKA